MSNQGRKMRSGVATWLPTHDEKGERCWVHVFTHQRVYRVQNGVRPRSPTPSAPTPVSPVQAPMVNPHQGMPYAMQSPNAAYGVQFMYPGGAYSGTIPSPSPNGSAGAGTTEYPSDTVNWF